MDFDPPFEHADVLFAGVVHQLAEFADALGANARQHRKHALAARGHRGFVPVAWLGKQFGHRNLQPLAQLQQLVVREREPPKVPDAALYDVIGRYYSVRLRANL